MKYVLIFISFFVIVTSLTLCTHTAEKSSSTPDHLVVSYRTYKTLKPSLPYIDSFPDLKIENLVMIGKVGIYGVGGDDGKVLRALRFQNISEAVEQRYNLPRHIILAMVMEESSGVDLLPNALGDGGFGLCHMQACVARDFGLRVYKNCDAMVCNGSDKRSCRDGTKSHLLNHALELKQLILQHGSNRRAVIQYDDRLNPVINLDAVGRMLACHMDGPLLKNFGPFRTAIARYAGLYNYQAYWRDVRHNMKVLANHKVLQRVEQRFNKLNPDLRINGTHADFKQYIALSQRQNYNFGLAQYKQLPYYFPRNSVQVLRTIHTFQ